MSARKKTDGKGPATSLVRIDSDIAYKLRIIASIRGTTIAKLLDPHLRPLVDREYSKAMKEAPDGPRSS